MGHWNVSIGHATFHDLRTWRFLPYVLAPTRAGSLYDYTTWTGTVIHHTGMWHMF